VALKGKIDDFGLVEIFQLISQQQRSGVLTIQSSGKKADVIFANGMISKVSPFYLSPKRDPFGDTGVKARLVTEEELQRALEIHNENLKNLEEVFLDINLLNINQRQKINNYLLVETLYDVLQWKSGDYEFNLKEIEHDKRLSTIIATEHILLDILRMIDEEPELYQKIPHFGIVFQKNPLDEKTLAGIDELTFNEKIIYRLVDGIKTTQDIIYQSVLGRYNTLKALHSLLEGHFIKKIATKKEPYLKPPIKKNCWQYVFYGIFPILIVLLMLWLRLLLSPSLSDDIASYKKVFAKTQFQKIKNALNVYFLKTGNYPVSLEDLVYAGLIKKDDLTYPGGVKYGYHLQADGGYRLEDAPL
jgi:competence protein ComGC